MVLTAVACALVVAASLAGATLLGDRRTTPTPAARTTEATTTRPGGVGVSGCRREPCQVLATATVGGTIVELVADSGAVSGRLRIGGPTTGQVIETTITDTGARLTSGSLQCVPASVSACLVRGETEKGSTGQVVVGRSDKWSALARAFYSQVGYLGLVNVVSDSAAEVVAVQYDCRTGVECAKRPIYAQVFTLAGQEVGCTRTYARVEQLPGYPQVQVAAAALRDCP